jgi:hypothetical protein
MSFHEIPALFRDWLSFPKDFDKNRRKRIYTVFDIFWLFLYQVLSPQGSCQNAVLKALSSRALKRKKRPSLHTSSYCKARIKLPLNKIREILSTLAERSQQEIHKKLLWFGRTVTVVDGTTCTMPDTKRNQKVFPQPDSQKKGCGFPLAKIVILFSLAIGTVIAWNIGCYTDSERALFHALLASLSKIDVLLADRGFSGYADFYYLSQNHIDFVIRISKKKRKHIKILEKLGKRDAIIKWFKPAVCPKWISKEIWNTIPPFLILREITYSVLIPGRRTKRVTVATSLLDHKKFPTHAFVELYLRRWMAELFFRDIKTTLGMDHLSCKSPDMVEKEILMYLIAYNLIRLMIFRASQIHHIDPERISFQATVNAFLHFLYYFEYGGRDQKELKYLIRILYKAISEMKNPKRPNRREPRTVKKRPKPYQYLTKLRSIFKEIPHRGKRPYS